MKKKIKCKKCKKKCSIVDALIHVCPYCKKQFCKIHAVAQEKKEPDLQVDVGHVCPQFHKVVEQHQKKLQMENPGLEETHRMVKV